MWIDPRWRKVIRDLWDNKSRTLLVVLSIAVGVFAFGGLFTARDIATADLQQQFATITPSNITMSIPAFDDALVHWMSRQEHVVTAQGRASHAVTLVDGDETYNLTLYAIDDYEAMQVNRISPEEGRWPPERGEILLERRSVPFAGAEMGETVVIELPTSEERYDLTLVGSIHDLDGQPATLGKQLTGYVTFDTMADLGLPRTYNQLEIVIEDSIANAPEDTGESRVRASHDGPAVGGSAPAELVRLSDDLQSKLSRRGVAVGAVQVRRSDEHWATDVVNAMMTILIGMGSFSLVLSGFLVINTISGLLAQQKRQIGMLKVVGSTTGQVTGVYMVTVASYGVLALLVALPLGQGLARAFLILVVSVLNFDILTFHLPFGIFLMEVVVALFVPLLAALFPILNAARMTAAAAISDYVVRPQSDPIDRTLARLSGLSTPMMLSVRNTFRRRTRLLLTLVTLVLAGMLFVSVFNVRYGLGIELGNMMSMSDFDVQLILGGSYNRAGLERRAEQIPGVTQAEGWAAAEMQRVRPGGDLGQTFTLYGVRHDSVFVNPILVEGRWLEEGDQYAIVVSSELLRDETGVQLGDDLTLELDDETHDWQVVGIVESSQPTAYAPFDTVSRVHGTADQTGMLLVRTEDRDAASLDSVAEALDTHLELRNLTVIRSTTQDELMSFVTGGFNIVTMILLGIAILVAAVGGLGLAGMMSLNVLERTREIGVLRAVGAANGPIRRIVLIEGMVVGLLSWLLALPLSVPASRVFGAILGQTMLGRPLPFVYGLTGPVVWLVIVLTISAVASLMPAQRASRISVREALAYE